jgi:hypothetical protein
MYSEESGARDFDDVVFPNAGAVCKFSGFTRNQDGQIVVKEKPSGAPGSDEVADYVYANCEIVSPVEHAGKELPLRIKLKGIRCYQNDVGAWKFHLSGLGLDTEFRPTGLFQNAKEMGFKITALDPQSQIGYEVNEAGVPVYIADEVERLIEVATYPLTPVQVLEVVIEAKLLQAAAAGHLFNVRTSEISWIVWDSLSALSAEDATAIQAQAQVQAAEGEAVAETIRQRIREEAAKAEDAQAFIERVRTYAADVQPDVDSSNLLASCTPSTLEHIQRKLWPTTEAAPTPAAVTAL